MINCIKATDSFLPLQVIFKVEGNSTSHFPSVSWPFKAHQVTETLVHIRLCGEDRVIEKLSNTMEDSGLCVTFSHTEGTASVPTNLDL